MCRLTRCNPIWTGAGCDENQGGNYEHDHESDRRVVRGLGAGVAGACTPAGRPGARAGQRDDTDIASKWGRITPAAQYPPQPMRMSAPPPQTRREAPADA